jgi:GNAT superfamily N-acetyltransferase
VTGFALRDAVAGDAVQLAALFRRASLANEGDRAALLAHPNALVWSGPPAVPSRCRVATDGVDGPPVGFATTVPVLRGGAGSTLELEDLFVDPPQRRRGVARLLVDDVLAGARGCGAHCVEVDANPHARAFYEAEGFVAVGEASTELGPGLRMRRPV